MLRIKILGPGCYNCKRLEELTKIAAEELDIEATFQKVTAWNDIMAYDILATPGLVINEKVVCAGRVPTKAEIASWLTTALAESEASR